MLRFESVCLGKRLIDVNLHIECGQWWALLGSNGAGKSSLLTLAAALENPDAGSIKLADSLLSEVSLAQLAARRCLVTQSYRTEFSISVQEMLSFFTQINGIPALVEEHLEISSLLDSSFDILSGGEKQRVHLARNLMQVWPSIKNGEALVLLDEPLQQMDVRHQMHALALIKALQQLGNTVVMSHHDINQAMQHCSHACLIQAGKVVQAGAREQVVTLENMQSLYGQRFKMVQDQATKMQYIMPD
ncbi:ABC transporter ATP-binding protein [Glaciecola sp. SC05]|uniref:ABC transporter ATP-binding protein n=1 Tax=Glaciecola sp. SC05 TaxID=1987355 RepID=UPI003527EC1D